MQSANVRTSAAFMSCACSRSSTRLQRVGVKSLGIFLDFIGHNCAMYNVGFGAL